MDGSDSLNQSLSQNKKHIPAFFLWISRRKGEQRLDKAIELKIKFGNLLGLL